MDDTAPRIATRQILAARSAKNQLDPTRPYAYLLESERGPDGAVDQVATIFLTNRECPFRCLMCDLWKNTLDERVPAGAIGRQIDFALERLGPARVVKLYNSGNFFDPQAIPPAEFTAIAARLRDFDRVIVENHPRLCGDECFRFAAMLAGELEIAIGLETVHPVVLGRLNKQMTLDDFSAAVSRLRSGGIAARAFVLLRPPYLNEAEGLEWAARSLVFAFDQGVACCAVIPTRAGNGILEQLQAAGHFEPPRIESMEAIAAAGIGMQRGRVLVDLWDCQRFSNCARCGPRRQERLHQMNLQQAVLPPVHCQCTAPGG